MDCHGLPQPDWRIVDLWIARELLARGIPAAEVERGYVLDHYGPGSASVFRSPNFSRAHCDPDDYGRKRMALVLQDLRPMCIQNGNFNVSDPCARVEYAVGSRRLDRFLRSKQMVNTLRQDFIYSEKRSRDMLFLEFERVLREGGSRVTVSRLTREAAIRARNRAQLEGYELSNWDTAARATMNAMLRASVILAEDGYPLPLTIAAQAAPVYGLADRFRDHTEAYLLEFLIRKLGDVTVRDHTALTHALFRQFDRNISMEDFEDRVVILLAGLSDRVVLTPDGTYSPIDRAN